MGSLKKKAAALSPHLLARVATKLYQKKPLNFRKSLVRKAMRSNIQTTYLRTMTMGLRAATSARWKSSKTRCERVWASS